MENILLYLQKTNKHKKEYILWYAVNVVEIL